MHTEDELYRRRQLRDAIALRMIGYEARTCTIRTCTGLSDDQVRRLYKYFISRNRKTSIKRRRGKSPRQLAYFTRNPLAQLEASMLATALATYGLLKNRKSRALRENSLEYAERFCDAYAEYQQWQRSGILSFEHAWYFRQALVTGNELCLDRCADCAGFYVSDALSFAARACPLCRYSLRPMNRNRSKPGTNPLPLFGNRPDILCTTG